MYFWIIFFLTRLENWSEPIFEYFRLRLRRPCVVLRKGKKCVLLFFYRDKERSVFPDEGILPRADFCHEFVCRWVLSLPCCSLTIVLQEKSINISIAVILQKQFWISGKLERVCKREIHIKLHQFFCINQLQKVFNEIEGI